MAKTKAPSQKPGFWKKIRKVFIRRVTIVSDYVLTDSVICSIRRASVILAVISLFLSLFIIFAHKNGWLTFKWPAKIPYDYYFSVYIAFTFILFYEVLSMIFILPQSIAKSIGKQYEVMSLIILRSIFEHVGEYRLAVANLSSHSGSIDWLVLENLIAGCLGSVVLFYLIRMYFTIQKHPKIVDDPGEFEGFVAVKQFVALSLIVIMLFLAILEVYNLSEGMLFGGIADISISHIFFKDMFSVMIFIDILLVLITTRYSSSYHVVYRTSGLAISTVVLRLSFSSSVLISVITATMAVLIGIGVTKIYNQFHQGLRKKT
ncbi:MAG: hypothetical protein OEZ36_03320 [Spirochaetota bacterium]|nr:hypothetical protein [Spirochaetota bacterium]